MNQPKKIYIAGKVTGEDRDECARKFEQAQRLLTEMGFVPVNPLEVVQSWETPWEEAMKTCIRELLTCDAIFLLPCAANSKGARMETKIAIALKIPVTTTVNNLVQTIIA